MKEKSKRHSVAFVVSTLIYGVAIASIFELFNSHQIEKIKKQTSHIEVALIDDDNTPQKEILQHRENTNNFPPPPIKRVLPPEEIETEDKTIQKESKEEKVIERPKTPPLAKLEENTQNKTQDSIKHSQKKEVAKEIEKGETQPPKIVTGIEKKESQNLLNTPVKEKPKQNLQEFKEKRESYFALLKQTIERNKYYPKNALRRGIEGDVRVKFTISTDGKLLLIEKIEGNSIFHTSIKDAIASSFPIFPPRNILTENTTLDLIVSYKLNYN